MIEKSIEILRNLYLPRQEFYFILASFLIYLKPPLSEEYWNDFKKKIMNNDINIEQGLFMTDEEKNPNIFEKSDLSKEQKIILKNKLNMLTLQMKRNLERTFPNLYKKEEQDIVCIPDTIKSYDEPTFFPKNFIENQIFKTKNYKNILTGQPFSWEFVESVKNNSISVPNINTIKKYSADDIIKYMKKELSLLDKTTKYCMICKKHIKTPFKSVYNYRMVYFCSLECMDKWNID